MHKTLFESENLEKNEQSLGECEKIQSNEMGKG